MAEIVELVAEKTVARAVKARKKNARASSGYRSVRLARKEAGEVSLPAGPKEPDVAKRVVVGEFGSQVAAQPEVPEERVPLGEGDEASEGESIEGRRSPEAGKGRYGAEECLRVYEVEGGAVVVFWRLDKINDWMAPVLGAACKELLSRSAVKRVLFDLSVVEEMSTAAIGTLMRFKNTIVYLEKSMSLVVGPKLRGQLERALIEQVFDLQENVYFLVGQEIQFVEKTKVKGRSGKGVERSFLRRLSRLLRVVLVGMMLGPIALAQTPKPKVDPFPSLAELEQMLAEAPDLRAIEVEMERQRMEESWGNRVFVYANHSQSFSSFVPFIPLNDFGVAGGTTVGVSVSVTLDRLLGKRTPADLDQRLKVLEYERLFQGELVILRTLFRQREKLIFHLEYLQMQRRTADLQLEKVQIGLLLVNQINGSALPFVFDPIDLAQAEERVARIKSERQQTELEIENSQTKILGLLGKGRIGP